MSGLGIHGPANPAQSTPAKSSEGFNAQQNFGEMLVDKFDEKSAIEDTLGLQKEKDFLQDLNKLVNQIAKENKPVINSIDGQNWGTRINKAPLQI